MKIIKSTPSNYHSYLLRLWQVKSDSGFSWRASLEDVQTGELHGFHELDALMQYLQDQGVQNQEKEMTLEKTVDRGN